MKTKTRRALILAGPIYEELLYGGEIYKSSFRYNRDVPAGCCAMVRNGVACPAETDIESAAYYNRVCRWCRAQLRDKGESVGDVLVVPRVRRYFSPLRRRLVRSA